MNRVLALMLSLTCALAAGVAAAETPENSLGRTISSFQLQDFRGKLYSLADFADQPVVVVYFLGTECPLARLYGPRMQKLYDQFHDRGVAFVGINSNAQDSMTELAAHARSLQIDFPILKDVGNKVADQFGATRTPEVFLLDKDRVIRYQGRIDGQFTFGSGVGLAKPQETRQDLQIAIDELVEGRQIAIPYTEPKGCLIGRVREPVKTATVTYSNQISRIIQNRCLECHREGQIAPFAMTDYDQVAGWGEMVAEVVRQQRMPPWHANPAFGHFANDLRMDDAEKQLIYQWVADGCPEGDPAELPAPIQFHHGWFLPDGPDQQLFISDVPVAVKAEGVEQYRYYEIDPGFTEDKWVRLAECMPGNRSVVHHIIVFVKPPGTEPIPAGSTDVEIRDMAFLVGFAPGTRPLVAPSGWAKRIPAGHTLVFEMHYTTVGTPQTDRSSVGLVYMDPKEVTHVMATGAVLNDKFKIPAFDANYAVDATREFEFESQMLALFPHMHIRGKSFRYELILPDGNRQVLLDVPQYDFNWQNHYIFTDTIRIPKNSKLHCTAVFDNSDENLANPDPSKEIGWGRQTWDEMMIGFYEFGVPIEMAKKVLAKKKQE